MNYIKFNIPLLSDDFSSSSAALMACSNLSSNQDLNSFTLRSPNILSLGSTAYYFNEICLVKELNQLVMKWVAKFWIPISKFSNESLNFEERSIREPRKESTFSDEGNKSFIHWVSGRASLHCSYDYI